MLAVAASVFGLSLALLVWTVEAGWPILTTYVFAGLAGGALPQVGSAVRARWSHVLDDTREVQTAFALEAVADEAVFMLGPVIVTVLATAIDPVAGLAVAVAACLGGTLALCAQRSTEPPARGPRRATGTRVGMPWATGGAAGGRLGRAGHPLRRRRGDHGGVRRASRTPGAGRGCCWRCGRSAACWPGC